MEDAPLNRIEKVDIAITHSAAGFYDSPAGRILGNIGKIGDEAPLLGIAALTALYGIATAKRRVADAGFRMARAELVAIVLKTLGKRSVNRTRPTALLEDRTYRMEPGTSSSHALQSFPSGHTAGAVAVARAFAHVFPERAPLALTGALIVGLLQLPRKAHFASDVAAGVLLGFLAERLSRPSRPVCSEPRGTAGVHA